MVTKRMNERIDQKVLRWFDHMGERVCVTECIGKSFGGLTTEEVE